MPMEIISTSKTGPSVCGTVNDIKRYPKSYLHFDWRLDLCFPNTFLYLFILLVQSYSFSPQLKTV